MIKDIEARKGKKKVVPVYLFKIRKFILAAVADKHMLKFFNYMLKNNFDKKVIDILGVEPLITIVDEDQLDAFEPVTSLKEIYSIFVKLKIFALLVKINPKCIKILDEEIINSISDFIIEKNIEYEKQQN